MRLLNEEVVGNLVYGYTEMSFDDFEKFKNQGFKLRSHRGPLGRGLYARYKYHHGMMHTSPIDGGEYGAGTYGDVIVKFKVSLSDKIVVFQYKDAKIAYPSGYRLVDQAARFGIILQEEVAIVDSALNQSSHENLVSVLKEFEKGSNLPIEVKNLQGAVNPDTFKIVLLSRIVDAINNDIPLEAPYVKTLSDLIKTGLGGTLSASGKNILDTDSVSQRLLRVQNFGSNVAGVLTYAGPPSIDGYVLFLNTPKLAVPVSYYSFDGTGLKELGFDEKLGGLSGVRKVGKNVKDFKVVVDEGGGNWVWNFGEGKDKSYGIFDLANFVNEGKISFEKLSNAYIHSNSLWQGKGGYLFKSGDASFKAAPFKELSIFGLFSSLVTSGKSSLPDEVQFKKFPEESRKECIKSASNKIKEMTPQQRIKDQNVSGIGWQQDIEDIDPAEWEKASKSNPFYINEETIRDMIRRTIRKRST